MEKDYEFLNSVQGLRGKFEEVLKEVQERKLSVFNSFLM
jgi:hypothetical protein